MTVTIVGAQLGDERKGAVVDLFGDPADVVARYQGGDNAGHTVVHDGEEYELSLVPSGAVRGKVGVLGNGCVVNPATLFEELDALREQGVDPDVRVAERAHVILPVHRVLEEENLIEPSSQGAITTDQTHEFVEDLDGKLEGIKDQLEAMKIDEPAEVESEIEG